MPPDRDARASDPDGPATAHLGVLGGTFNPPHVGHLALARHARDALGLDRVLLMPANRSPGKPAGEDPGPRHRLRMCRLAIEGDDARSPGSASGLAACALEVQRGGVSYTVDTLRAIHAARPNAQLTLIVGADVALTLPAWHESTRLAQLADIAVAVRGETGRDEIGAALAPLLGERSPTGQLGDGVAAGRLPGERLSEGRLPEGRLPEGRLPEGRLPEGRLPEGRLRYLDMPVVDVSSSAVRDRVKRGEAVAELVGSAVASYIAEHRLYSRPVEVGAA